MCVPVWRCCRDWGRRRRREKEVGIESVDLYYGTKRDKNCWSITARSCRIQREAIQREGRERLRERNPSSERIDWWELYLYKYCYVTRKDFLSLNLLSFSCFPFFLGQEFLKDPSFVTAPATHSLSLSLGDVKKQLEKEETFPGYNTHHHRHTTWFTLIESSDNPCLGRHSSAVL